MSRPAFGPFRPETPAADRAEQLAALHALIAVIAGPRGQQVARDLDAARRAPDDADALDQAARAIDRLPSRPRRQVLATFNRLNSPDSPLRIK